MASSTTLPALALELAETLNSIEKGDDSLSQLVNVTYNSNTGIAQITGTIPADKVVGDGAVKWTPQEYLSDPNFDVTTTPIADASPAGASAALVLTCERIASTENAKIAAGTPNPAGVGTTVNYPTVDGVPQFQIDCSLAFTVDTSTGQPKFVATDYLA